MTIPVAHPIASHVAAANNLTARWCAEVTPGNFALTGAGLWPLLGLLAHASSGPAHGELVAALSMTGQDAKTAALALLQDLEQAEGIDAALGIWVAKHVQVHDQWARTLPAGTIGQLTGQQALDTWASEHTGGLIERFPLTITPETLLVLATALAVRTQWWKPFGEDVLEPRDGPWQGGQYPGLSRVTHGIDTVNVLLAKPGLVTRVVVEGDNGIDVHLLTGHHGETNPGGRDKVLAAGIGALAGEVEVETAHPDRWWPAAHLGPALDFRNVEAVCDKLVLHLPPFNVHRRHDLLANADLFGLRTATTDCPGGHFPAISNTSLRVDAAAQDMFADFNAHGFNAAAVTAIAGTATASLGPPPLRQAVQVTATFDQPFGYLAVHRDSELVVVAGWVDRIS
jgi:Serpin (serine protease inhibitor)